MIRIVLVEPREAGNVGAVARAMKNFGLTDLAIVGRHPQLHPLAGWWASGADDLVAAATFHESLHAAIGDAHLTVATTSGRGRDGERGLTPAEVASLYGELGESERLAIVFGREDHGLAREEVELCHRTATIETSTALPTMNLAQSVAIFAYELAGRSGGRIAKTSRSRARAILLERVHERLQALLLEAGFLHQENPDRIYREIRRWLVRLELDEREAEIVLGIVRQLEWRIR
ncbi:MAG TPA: TrmJ/YjtD family RNA methyltransferase [Thermoanaerobaculia bacterium]|nr:TrmJ/YjtD family RNA methyltransferase [Thermoanaerobaculia bacterium]